MTEVYFTNGFEFDGQKITNFETNGIDFVRYYYRKSAHSCNYNFVELKSERAKDFLKNYKAHTYQVNKNKTTLREMKDGIGVEVPPERYHNELDFIALS